MNYQIILILRNLKKQYKVLPLILNQERACLDMEHKFSDKDQSFL